MIEGKSSPRRARFEGPADERTTHWSENMDLLVIEDDPVIGKSLRKGLLEAGHGCVWAKEGERGLELAAGQQFDAIVLDLMLPGRPGIEAA